MLPRYACDNVLRQNLAALNDGKHMSIYRLLVVLLLLGACAARPSLQELEEEALATGDWSRMERRIEMDRKMGMIDGVEKCDNGYVLHCQAKGEREVCGCISPLDREAYKF